MAARASFSTDPRIVKVPLPNSVLLKDYLIDDLSSCSSNGFRSYPRRQCCTKVRYLIEIDLNKHINLPPKKKKLRKSKAKLKPKSKSSLVHKASAAVVNVFKNFRFSGSGKPTKADSQPKKLSRKLSKHGFWNRTTDRHNKELKRFDEPLKEKKKVPPPRPKVSNAVTTTAVEVNITVSNSNSSASSDSYFTATSGSSSAGNSFKINIAQNDVEESLHATEKNYTAKGMTAGAATANAIATATAASDSPANGDAKKVQVYEKKEQLSPVSVMEFPCDSENDDDDEVTSPFQRMPKVQKIKSLSKLTPVRLEERIKLSESTTRDLLREQSSNQTEKKANALLQQLKATMSSRNQFESITAQNVLLLGFFMEGIIEGNISNFALLQEAKDWINGKARETTYETTYETQNNKLTYIRDMEKGKSNWSTYDDQVEKQEIGLELECHVFTSLVEEMLLEFYW